MTFRKSHALEILFRNQLEMSYLVILCNNLAFHVKIASQLCPTLHLAKETKLLSNGLQFQLLLDFLSIQHSLESLWDSFLLFSSSLALKWST